jgi:excinuclease ABC subunit A
MAREAGTKKHTTLGEQFVSVYGARVHNLKDIDVFIPRNRLTVITGLSGSGKSSLAFDTIYAEGQRRYMETLSAYARQFLGGMERPDVDRITGLSPVISIEQKTTIRNPRSTVGTITEIYDFLRLLYARAGMAYSYNTGEAMVRYTDDQILDLVMKAFNGTSIYLLAPVVKGRKGHYKELFEQIRKKGFLHVRINGAIREITHGLKVDRYKTHFIEIVIDKLTVTAEERKRLRTSIQLSLKQGHGIMMILEKNRAEPRYFSRQLMCPSTGISYNEPAPHSFSFNSPQGACSECNGLGVVPEVDRKKIIPDPNLSIRRGGIQPLGAYKNSLIFWQLESIGHKYDFDLNTPIKDIPHEAMNIILNGSDETFMLKNSSLGISSNYFLSFEGVVNYIANQEHLNNGDKPRKKTSQFIRHVRCPGCQGYRLKKESLHFRIHDKHIGELSAMDMQELAAWLAGIEQHLTRKQNLIAGDLLKEIRNRLRFLLDVGLVYLSLDRPTRSLSGGESQRIRLATQIGSQLVNVLYILDEPSIGLHQRDNKRLIESLRKLRDSGNSIVVVEHDKEMITSADHIVDMGPLAGRHGGKVVAEGPVDVIKRTESLTAEYLNGKRSIQIPSKRRRPRGDTLLLKGARGHNLKNVDVTFPLGVFICITGVSGSGKSSLINQTLHPILSRHFYKSLKDPLPYQALEGIEHLDKVIEVDQSPLGRTPRSNPATYTGLFSDVRKLFEQTPEAKIRGYKAGRFSFNVKGGRCETCQGAGVKTIEMNFLPDVYVLCDECNGKRYNNETLAVLYKGKSISQVLDMTINQATEFFENVPSLSQKLNILKDVGLGYIRLGQPSTTLSGGESQRVKLAAELSKRDTGKTLYILDEPTTGLHFDDVRVLLQVLDRLVQRGNTVMVIEHNMDVVKMADYIIDLGLEGGGNGGSVVATGTPEQIVTHLQSHTARFLKKELNS